MGAFLQRLTKTKDQRGNVGREAPSCQGLAKRERKFGIPCHGRTATNHGGGPRGLHVPSIKPSVVSGKTAGPASKVFPKEPPKSGGLQVSALFSKKKTHKQIQKNHRANEGPRPPCELQQKNCNLKRAR